MAAPRFRPNKRNIATFLKSPETRAAIERQARRIEAGAGPGQWRVDVQTGSKRVRGAVIGNYQDYQLEQARAALLRALRPG
jgi:hypothetical protein